MRAAIVGSVLLALWGCSTEKETVTVPGECADGGGLDVVVVDSEGDTDLVDSGTPVDTGMAATDSGAPVTDSGTVTDTGSDTGPGCTIKTGGDFCTKIPKMTFTGKQIVDGVGDEFCDIPASALAMKTGISKIGRPPTLLPSKLQARIAWSSLGIHGHIHVEDPEVFGLGPIAASDEIRLFISGKAPIFGEFVDRRDKSAFALQMFAPSPRDLALPGFTGKPGGYAQLFYLGHQKATDMTCQGIQIPLPGPAEFASRIVPGGYELEVFLPWAVLGRTTAPSSGDEIAIDLMMTDFEDPEGETPPYFPNDPALIGQVFYKLSGASASTTCCPGGTLEPDCDDRAWCVSPLE